MLPQTFGPVFVSATLDGSGNATVSFQAVGQNVMVTRVAVRCTTAVNEAIAYVYKGQIGDPYLIEGSLAASTGDSSDTITPLADGEKIYIVWTGGDAGATATATVSGNAEIGSGGFRAVY